MSLDRSLLERHLDLAPLRGRRRGVTHCIFQPRDRKPSLSVDLDRGLFHCFSCGERGGLRRFAELVGERPVAPGIPARATQPADDRERAWREVLRLAQAQDARRAEISPWWLANDLVRIRWNAVRHARRWAQVLGPDHPRTWPLLALAARVETEAAGDVAQLDALLEEGRIA